jgi:hypothetical protein
VCRLDRERALEGAFIEANAHELPVAQRNIGGTPENRALRGCLRLQPHAKHRPEPWQGAFTGTLVAIALA